MFHDPLIRKETCSNGLSPEQREMCRVFSFVGFSSCVAWWTTMGCESSKRRPEKRDHVSFAANMTRFLNSR